MKKITYDGEGNVLEEVEVEDIEIQDPMVQIPQSAIDGLITKLEDPTVNTITELKDALKELFGNVQ